MGEVRACDYFLPMAEGAGLRVGVGSRKEHSSDYDYSEDAQQTINNIEKHVCVCYVTWHYVHYVGEGGGDHHSDGISGDEIDQSNTVTFVDATGRDV